MTPILDFAVGSRSRMPGEASGDAFLAREDGPIAVVAVADGLGHGPEAEAAARRTLALLAGVEHGDLLAAMRHCHEGLKATRGAVLSLARIDRETSTLTWVGVGNVRGELVRRDARSTPTRESLLLRGGVLGRTLPRLQAGILAVDPGDTLVLMTDGIDPDFPMETLAVEPPRAIADRILAERSTGADDALVLVARFQPEPP